MKKTLSLFIVILVFSCVSKNDSQSNTDLDKKSDSESIEIQYSDSREKTIGSLKKIWECELPIIAKSKTTINGEISSDIHIIISEFKSVDSEKKETNINLTAQLIKESVLNYDDFSDLKIITSYTTSDGERMTSYETVKMRDL